MLCLSHSVDVEEVDNVIVFKVEHKWLKRRNNKPRPENKKINVRPVVIRVFVFGFGE